MPMIIKHNWMVVAVSVLIAAAIPVLYKGAMGTGSKIDYKTFRQRGGWGYDIVVNRKLFIHQECIPAISEKKEFSTEVQATEAARLVMSKLKNNKLPTLSLAEVEQICSTGDSVIRQSVAHE
jgi:hypothetical protein